MGFGEAAEPTKLVVSELHTHISGADLKEVFAPFGAVVGIEVQTANGQPDGPSIGVAVVTFEEAAHAKDAQAAINGLELAGKKIIVDFVREAAAPPMPAMGAIPSLLSTVGAGIPMGMPAGMAGSLPPMSMPRLPNMMPGMAGALPIPGTVPGMAPAPGGGGDGGGMGSLDDNFDAEKKAMQVARNSGATLAQFRRNSGAILRDSPDRPPPSSCRRGC